MEERKKDANAFPGTDARGFVSEGMTLRDYFAGQALVGLLADSRWDCDPEEGGRIAYRWADGMMKAREGGQ